MELRARRTGAIGDENLPYSQIVYFRKKKRTQKYFAVGMAKTDESLFETSVSGSSLSANNTSIASSSRIVFGVGAA